MEPNIRDVRTPDLVHPRDRSPRNKYGYTRCAGWAHSSGVWDRSSPTPWCAAAAPHVCDSLRTLACATRRSSDAHHNTACRCIAHPVTASKRDSLRSPPARGNSRWTVATHEITLPRNTNLWMRRLNQLPPGLMWQVQLFFSASPTRP